MDEWMLGVLLGIMGMGLIGCILSHMASHRAIISALERKSNDLVGAIDGKSSFSLSESVLEVLRAEISDAIGEVAGNMRVPTAVDHLAGVFANVMQMREQWKIQKEATELNANPLISQPPVAEDYGTP
tara:strand:- start:104 stop:487 length:384 start_codon:yes stop_codon:yes gene_type:complete